MELAKGEPESTRDKYMDAAASDQSRHDYRGQETKKCIL